MTLIDAIQFKLGSGLRHVSITNCGDWAKSYIILGKPIAGPLRFDHHPWSEEWMNCSTDWVGMKAAQMAMTMSALARTMYTMDILRNDVLYVLPKRSPDAADFSKAKFDALLELSPYLRAMFNNVKNIGHKQAGNVNLFLRGSRSRSALKSISVGLRIYDEYDEMSQRNMVLADERSSGYRDEDTQNIRLSTPTVPDFGIDLEFQNTTREHYTFSCPKCGRWTELVFPDDLVITTDKLSDDAGLRRSHIICHDCKRPLDHESKIEWLSTKGPKGAKWIVTNASEIRGFYINQLYSTVVPPWKIAKLALKARINGADEQEYYNSKGGLPHAVTGARLNEIQIRENCRNYNMLTAPRVGLITMGVDVGHKSLFYWIDRWLLPPTIGNDLNTYAIAQTLAIGYRPEFNDVHQLMREYQIAHTVIDVDPNFRSAVEFAQRYDRTVSLCRFVHNQSKHKIKVHTKEDDYVIHAHKTYWMDIAMNRFKHSGTRIMLPADIDDMVVKHLMNPVRIERKNDEGNIIASYQATGDGADHLALARVYCEIALPLAVSIAQSIDIRDLL